MSSGLFVFSVAKQLVRLEKANREEGWGFGKPVFKRLERTAPDWPTGRLAMRSLRIRFGSGWAGVSKTFEIHTARIAKTFGQKGYYRNPCVQSGRERIRLWAGNRTHQPCVEWVSFDLDTHRNRKSVWQVRDTSCLADELFAMAWLFPEVVRSIDFDAVPGFLAAGYELAVPGLADQGGRWSCVPCLSFGGQTRRVNLEFDSKVHNHDDCSVPTALAA